MTPQPNTPEQPKREAYIDIVFDGPPGPETGRFVEVEDESGKSIRFGEWVQRPDGYWALRFATQQSELERLKEVAWIAYRDASISIGKLKEVLGVDIYEVLRLRKERYPNGLPEDSVRARFIQIESRWFDSLERMRRQLAETEAALTRKESELAAVRDEIWKARDEITGGSAAQAVNILDALLK